MPKKRFAFTVSFLTMTYTMYGKDKIEAKQNLYNKLQSTTAYRLLKKKKTKVKEY